MCSKKKVCSKKGEKQNKIKQKSEFAHKVGWCPFHFFLSIIYPTLYPNAHDWGTTEYAGLV